MNILSWRPMQRNTLLGFVKIELPSGMVIADVSIMNGQHGPWASPPSKPIVSRDGSVAKDQNGKIRYSPIIEFSSKEVRDRFSNGVVAALRLVHPEAFS